ncbi:MAG: hypothetical protein U9Q90_06650 [Campylobacterota bacterium]|nr:hypothetical protein [Campylobacterota bacterium]
MQISNTMIKFILTITIPLFLANCGGGGGSDGGSADSGSAAAPGTAPGAAPGSSATTDPKYSYEYEGLKMYAQNMSADAYQLASLNDSEFNALNSSQREVVADKLLSTLYFGMPRTQVKSLIDSGNFISTIQTMITGKKNDLEKIESRLNDSDYEDDSAEFSFSSWPTGTAEVSRILARFYAMEYLDKHYVDYWSAYVLSSTIMFSPAYELASSHAPNIDRVYGALVRNFREEVTAKYATFLHMISDDNWRRFRSPEDNGREMMEIYLMDFDDTHVPVAGQALKNWKLDRDNDTLVIGLDENTKSLQLFGATITDGFDFYRELAKSPDFNKGVTGRLVEVYFPTFSPTWKSSIVDAIISSDPKTWQDILLQIVFSKTYLLHSDKPKSAEELFYSLSRKIHFEHRRGFFSDFARSLAEMNQASMKYKLGKYTEVPLDTQSFITYHKFIREKVLIRDKNEWSGGWVPEVLIKDELFEGISSYEYQQILDTLIDHLFLSTIARTASSEEKNLFRKHMLQDDGTYSRYFELFNTDDNPLSGRIRASITIMDYISRLSQTYRFEKVQ